jgi:apolipoprotein N-acyltransferase
LSKSEPTATVHAYDLPPPWWQTHSDLVWAGIVALLTIVLAVVSFPPFHAPEFAYVMAAPGVLWAYRKPRFRLYAWTMVGAQAGVWIALLGWLHHVTWVGLVLLGAFLGALTSLWYLAVWWMLTRIKAHHTLVRIVALLGLAGLWVLLEWVRGWLFGGFPWLPLAASQWQRPLLLQIASYTGAEGVSFLLIYFCLGLGTYGDRLMTSPTRGLRRRSPEFMVALLLVMVPSFLLLQEVFAQKREELGRFALVQPDIPQVLKWDPEQARNILDTFESLVLSAGSAKPDLIIGPESVMPWALKADPNVQPWLESLANRTGAPLLLGVEVVDHPGLADETWQNSVAVTEPGTGLQPGTYAKRKLVPFGEYIPLRPLFGWIDKFVPIGGDFKPGTGAGIFLIKSGMQTVKLAPLICYEDIFPSLARYSAAVGADALVVVTNDAWYGEGGAAYQHAAHSVLRAVETRRPVIRVGNAGWSGWIDEYGTIRAVLQRNSEGRLTTNPKAEDATIYFRGTEVVGVSRDTRWTGRQSFYVLHGDWFVAVCAGLAVFGYLLLRVPPPPRPVEAAE